MLFSGRMSDCPAYLGITIASRLDLDEELFRYDALILCPTDFNLTFSVPNWPQHFDKAFDVRLQDAKRSHSIYLTQLALEEVDSPVIISKENLSFLFNINFHQHLEMLSE